MSKSKDIKLAEDKGMEHQPFVGTRSCQHEATEDTGQFDDLYVYLKCVNCGEVIAEDRMDFESGRYYWPQDEDE